MTEEKNNGSENKENTIDILVSPKKKEEKAPAPMQKDPARTPARRAHTEKAPAKSADAPSAEKQTPKPVKTPSEGKALPKLSSTSADRTRAISVSDSKPSSVASKMAQETRVGRAVPVVEKNPRAAAQKEAPGKATGDGVGEESEPKSQKASGLQTTLITVLIYVAVVVGISAVLSYLGIVWANDVFALVKDEVTATVEIPENAQIGEVADILKEKGIIEYPFIFEAYISFKNKDLAFKAGEYELKSTLNYDQIVSLIKDRLTRKIVTITIPEGYTVDEIIEIFVSQGIGTKEGFVDAIQNYDYTYRFMDELNKSGLGDGRKYRLEGYLFPDTYEFYTDSSPIAIVDKMLTAFEAHFEDAYYDRLTEMGRTLDEVVTLASIVQMEGKYVDDYFDISSTFYNRLNSKSMKKLQSDATVQYCLPEHKEDLTYADLAVDSPYNTYKREGLPPSAISNPGWEAIQAALYPNETGYYYFISDTDGQMVFASTEREHDDNKAFLSLAIENGTTVAIEKAKRK